MAALDLVLSLLAALSCAPAVVFATECFASLLPVRRIAGAQVRPRLAVLMPAHDEALGIVATIEGLLPQLADGDRIVVVADNCADDTAALARQAGAEVIERRHATDRGKGYALAFGLDHLAADPPDVVIVVDADCRFEQGTLGDLARQAVATDRPAQAEYLMHPPRQITPGSAISTLAFLVKNRTRARGLSRLGLPIGLTGTGMAFPWRVIRDSPAMGSYLAEDLLMGVEMAVAGHPPMLCTDVHVTSVLPEADDAAIGQRRRWEHGHLTTIVQQTPRLLALGIRKLRVDLVAIALDLSVPPLALLVLMLVGATAALSLWGLVGASWRPASIAASGVGLVGLAVLAAWAKHGRALVPGRYLLAVPLYVAWKIPIYLSFALRRRQKTWERTARD